MGSGPGPVSFPYSPKHCKVAALLLGERTLSVTVLDHLQLATMKQVPSVFDFLELSTLVLTCFGRGQFGLLVG